MEKPNVYMEIEDDRIFLYTLVWHKKKALCDKNSIFTFSRHEILDGVLYNTTEIQKKLQSFFKEHSIQKPRAVIAYTSLQRMDKTKITAVILQLCLIVCKTGVDIKNITNTTLLKKENSMKFAHYFREKDLRTCSNLISLIKTKTRSTSPTLLLVLSILMVSIPYTLYTQYKKEKNHAAWLEKQETNLANQHEEIKDKLHALHCLEDNHNGAENSKTLLPYSQPAIARTLTSISVAILHQEIWLKKISFTFNKTKKNKQENSVEIDAAGKEYKEISSFVKVLKQKQIISKMCIHSIKPLYSTDDVCNNADNTHSVANLHIKLSGCLAV